MEMTFEFLRLLLEKEELSAEDKKATAFQILDSLNQEESVFSLCKKGKEINGGDEVVRYWFLEVRTRLQMLETKITLWSEIDKMTRGEVPFTRLVESAVSNESLNLMAKSSMLEAKVAKEALTLRKAETKEAPTDKKDQTPSNGQDPSARLKVLLSLLEKGSETQKSDSLLALREEVAHALEQAKLTTVDRVHELEKQVKSLEKEKSELQSKVDALSKEVQELHDQAESEGAKPDHSTEIADLKKEKVMLEQRNALLERALKEKTDVKTSASAKPQAEKPKVTVEDIVKKMKSRLK